MKKIVLVLLVIFFGGCSGGIHSSLVDVEIDLAAPILGLNGDVPVVYPYRPTGGNIDPMVGTFGPSWKGLHNKYPEYKFN